MEERSELAGRESFVKRDSLLVEFEGSNKFDCGRAESAEGVGLAGRVVSTVLGVSHSKIVRVRGNLHSISSAGQDMVRNS
jgi:hypothetical protein